jgi:organic radical activating enzyme
MRPTITASVWNYCQIGCSYCVAGSHLERWRPKKTFEVWKPKGFELLNDYELRVKFGVEWWHEQCPDKDRFLNPADVLSFEYMAAWLHEYRPGATIHLSGGEPLLRPDIEEQTAILIEAGFQVVMFTNGLLIDERRRLLDMPLKWCVTFHQNSGLSVQDFLGKIEPIRSRSRPLIVHTVISNMLQAKALSLFRHYFDGYRFFEKWHKNPTRTTVPGFKYDPADVFDIASNRLSLITPDGAVYPCNTCRIGPVGNIYQGTFDAAKAAMMDVSSAECIRRNCCPAYQTAALLESL